MKRPLLVFLAGLLLGGLAVAWWFFGRDNDEAPIPDEKRVAMIELESKQSGPGYFHAEGGTQPDEQGIFWIDPDKAEAQVDRVLRERKLDESEHERLMKLIHEVAEPNPSRAVGGNRVNVARLNVALDANAR